VACDHSFAFGVPAAEGEDKVAFGQSHAAFCLRASTWRQKRRARDCGWLE
jgi:hypothetical protein